MLKILKVFTGSAALFLIACGQTEQENTLDETTEISSGPAEESSVSSENQQPERPQEAVSFSGNPLFRFDIDAARLEESASKASVLENQGTLSEDDYYALGSHYVDQGRFQDAIALYTKGLEEYPESVKLRRHRGHRYINVRELDRAIIDLEEAAELMGENPPEVMQVSVNGVVNGTYEHWVWYHIGLYHYLNGNYDQAAKAYEKCVETATSGSLRVGATDWLYNSLVKGGQLEAAAAVIAEISPDIDANKEAPYFKRVMLYKGLNNPEELIDIEKPGPQWSGGDITTGYGVANWYKMQGDTQTAQKIYDNILQTPYWSSWAYVVTDKEQSMLSATQ